MAGTTAKTGNGGIEILSPAGSYDILKTAINAGADAVYAGGSCFGARAFAQNFTEKELLEAIDYVHLHGKKLYLTVNTLVKNGRWKMCSVIFSLFISRDWMQLSCRILELWI